MTDKDKYVTELDIIGLYEAAAKDLAAIYTKQGSSCRVFNHKFGQRNVTAMESFENLVKRDKEREKDGFSRKIQWQRILVSPGKVISVPYVEEGQLVHGQFEPKGASEMTMQAADQGDNDLGETSGSGKGEVGDVIGVAPLSGSGDDDAQNGSGDRDDQGEATEHLEEEAYEFGKRLMKELELPNLKEKTKKFPTNEYSYDLTDRHHGSGQVLDKKETLRRVIKANLSLGRIEKEHPDPSKMVIGPDHRVYRVLSREKVWKSQAVVFFLRDYSWSMSGEPTKALISQHLMIYAWLMAQYEKRVIPRFFVHDTEAKEVTAQQYFTLSAGGGTYIASGYKAVTHIVKSEGLESAYNIYLFQGTDGDDGDTEGREAIPEIQKILGYVNRMGVTLFKHPYYQGKKTIFEQYISQGGILKMSTLFRMHTMDNYYNVTDEMNVNAIKTLIAQD